jgi:hypothetical protein
LQINDNEIVDFSQLDILAERTPKLETIYLEGNPLSQDNEYRTKVVKRLPHLKQLDATPVQ